MRRPAFTGLAVLLGMLLAACVVPAKQPVSPPPAVAASPLIGNRWRLEQILAEGETVSFAADAPVYIEFTPTGYVTSRYDGLCFAAGHDLVTFTGASVGNSTYRLTPGTGAAPSCGGLAQSEAGAAICADELGLGYSLTACRDLLERQYAAPDKMYDTNSYELIGNHLILRGEGVEMWYVMDNP